MVGWWTLNISNSAGSETSPFSDGEDVTCSFVVTGDKGDSGTSGQVQVVLQVHLVLQAQVVLQENDGS